MRFAKYGLTLPGLNGTHIRDLRYTFFSSGISGSIPENHGGLEKAVSTSSIMATKGGEVATEKKSNKSKAQDPATDKVKFEIYGEEMIEKIVKLSGNSGRVYLPPNWVGHHVKIIRID